MALKVILNLPRTTQREGSSGRAPVPWSHPLSFLLFREWRQPQRWLPTTCRGEPCVQPLRGPPNLSEPEVSALCYETGFPWASYL